MKLLRTPIELLYLAIRRLHIVDVTQLMHLRGEEAPDLSCPAGYEIRRVRASELSELIESQRVADQIGDPEALRDGNRAVLAAFHRDHAVSFVWLAKQTVDASDNYSRAEHLGTSIDLPEGTVFVYNVWTHPDHRGKRLISSMLAYALRHRVAGAWSLLTAIDWTNSASIRAFHFTGMKPLGSVVRFGRGWLQISLIPAAARGVGVRIAEDAPGYKVAF